MEQLSSFTMAAEEATAAAVVATQTDFSSSQNSEYSNYSLYGTLALVSTETFTHVVILLLPTFLRSVNDVSATTLTFAYIC